MSATAHSQRDIPTDRIGRDLSKGWLPVTMVLSIMAAVAVGVWWLAGEHAAIADLRKDRDTATAAAADQAHLIAEQAKAIAALDRAQAAIVPQLEAIRAELQRNSAILEDLRRRP